MIRALLKSSLLFTFGRLPGGANFYREFTRDKLGTQATHVDKLKRVWPGYVEVWTGDGCGLDMEGLDVWIHESGWTAYAPLVNFLLTGKGGAVTNSHARLLDRYLSRAVNGALETGSHFKMESHERWSTVEALRWETKVENALKNINAVSLQMTPSSNVPLADKSIDLCHSGGVLEHYNPDDLKGFFAECFRILRPGGVSSHVLDHRDHMYHADKNLPFLAHLMLSDPAYNLVYGHPLTYHNRLLPGQIMSMLEAVGFEKIAVRRMTLPTQKYMPEDRVLEGNIGIKRSRLAKRFQAASNTDLHTAAAHYLYRKPKLA